VIALLMLPSWPHGCAGVLRLSGRHISASVDLVVCRQQGQNLLVELHDPSCGLDGMSGSSCARCAEDAGECSNGSSGSGGGRQPTLERARKMRQSSEDKGRQQEQEHLAIRPLGISPGEQTLFKHLRAGFPTSC
jgi:hypothetical protein